MGHNMPYQLEKGPYFSVTESVFEDIPRRIHVLIAMRQGADPDDIPSLESASLDPPAGGIDTLAQRRYHENRHWYGKWEVPPFSGNWVDQDPFDSWTNPRTGYWHNWYGNAERIIRETYTRAIEVSLGIPHDPRMTDYEWIWLHKTRWWQIEIFNRCPAPWLEGWVSWRGKPGGDGHVTVHIHTPSHDDSNLLHSPFRTSAALAGTTIAGNMTPEYRDERTSPPPIPSDGERGIWVVGHEVHDLVDPPYVGFLRQRRPAPPNPQNDEEKWDIPWFGGVVWSHDENATTSDKIVVVRPNEPDGGVLANGRPY
jgi:hypothetical protein